MEAVVLAAGYATRLFPYTRYYPKPLLKIGGKTLLDATVERLISTGDISRVHIVVNNRFERSFRVWQESLSSPGKTEIRIINDGTNGNEERLGSMGDLALALEEGRIRDDIVVAASDKLFQFDLDGILSIFRRTGGVVNACDETDDRKTIAGRHGCIVKENSGRIIQFQEKPEEPLSSVKSVALYVYPEKSFPLIHKYLAGGGNPDAPGYFSEWLCPRFPMFAWPIQGECVDVGHPEAYRVAWKRHSPEDEVKAFLVCTDFRKSPVEDVLKQLSGWSAVTIVYIGLPGGMMDACQVWLQDLPLPVPVDLVPLEDDQIISDERIVPWCESCSLYLRLPINRKSWELDLCSLKTLLNHHGTLFISEGTVRSFSENKGFSPII